MSRCNKKSSPIGSRTVIDVYLSDGLGIVLANYPTNSDEDRFYVCLTDRVAR